MAVVANKDGQGIQANGATGALDKKFATPNRSNAGTPVAAVVPLYAGEIVLDTTNRVLWEAVGLTNADWQPVTKGIN